MSIWQIAAGDGNRDYTDLFIRFGIAAVGPGDSGPFDDNREAYEEYAEWSYLRAFHDDLQADDLLVLKQPYGRQWRAVALGRVTGTYAWDPRLEDVEGWDLQHTARVDWRVPANETIVPGLTRGTLKRVHQQDARADLERLWETLDPRGAKPADLPQPAGQLSDEALITRLVDHGVATGQAEAIQRTIWRIRRLARWYGHHGGSVGEHEIRTFLIVPLLLAMGWPEQRIKIEYQHTDIALWDRPFPNEDAQVEMVIETKRLWDGLGGASVDQAMRYAARYGRCKALVVSDGLRFKLLRRRGDDWMPSAYANLLKLRDRHPTDAHVAGADELFLSLLP